MNYLPIIDLLIKIKKRFRDIFFHYIRKPFIGSIGKGSYIKSGVKLLGNPYRIKIGNNFKIWENCIIEIGKGKLIIGNNGAFGAGVIINVGNSTIDIGNEVFIAIQSKLIAYSHHYYPGKSIAESHIEGDIIIGDNVLIGAGVTILPGITIGKGAVVGAGAVVTKNVEPYTIVGGVPAKFIKKRVV